MQRQLTFGGGVSPRNTRLRGQSTIEYALILAIIGLVFVFAGPQVSGAIRNQFNLVGNTVDSGTDGDSFMSAEEKAHREAMKTVASKEAKDWTLDEQKAAATDIAKNGTSSVVYAKAKAAMDANTSWPMKLTDGRTVTYRIIGINHDDLADGSGKAGLTFVTTTYRTFGSQKMNSGEIWNLMPDDFQSKVQTVTKLTNNTKGQDQNSIVTPTNDRLYLLSSTELWGDKDGDGTQYEFYRVKGCTSSSANWRYIPGNIWTRSLVGNYGFRCTSNDGGSNWTISDSTDTDICPAFCF
ncbi:Flp/Fap pilin component [Collinsella aerofaciens]|nr:Flp/Fap pilin component [Collinsella aerofaciens]